MSRLIKIIDENTIELADYRCPEVIFKSSQNPPTLQNIKDEIEHLEWYCTFKDTINPFQMYAENKRLKNIIDELKEWFKGYHKSYASCKWYEEDYIEFIEHLEEELKGEDKE